MPKASARLFEFMMWLISLYIQTVGSAELSTLELSYRMAHFKRHAETLRSSRTRAGPKINSADSAAQARRTANQAACQICRGKAQQAINIRVAVKKCPKAVSPTDSQALRAG